MCRFFTSIAILAVVSTAKATDDCCLTSGDSSSCPEGKTFMEEVDSFDAETGNTYHACCAGGNIEMELETLLENLDMCGSDVQTASTTEDEEDGDEETTTTTTGSGGVNLQNEDCCTPEGTDCPIQMPNPISAAEARAAGGIICCEDGVSQMNMGKDLPMSCAALATEEATDGAEVEVMDEDTTTTTTASGGGGASDCCLIASDSSCPDGKTYMDEVDTLLEGEPHTACCTGGNFEMELMDLDLCTGTASDGGGGDTAAAPNERVVLAIGMILVGALLQ